MVTLPGITGLATDDEKVFGRLQQVLLALWYEVILCGAGSVVIPADDLQTICTGVRVTQRQGPAGSRH